MKLNRIEKYIVNNPLRRWVQRRFEIPHALKSMPSLPAAANILEIGCSNGAALEELTKKLPAAICYGLEYDAHMLSQRSRNDCIHYLQGDGTCPPFAENTFDAIICFGVLHHIPDWQRALTHWCDLLTPGGYLYLEEFYGPLITHPIINKIVDHPQENRFDHATLRQEVLKHNVIKTDDKNILNLMGFQVYQQKETRTTT